ncbi:MAG: DUF5995 family protein [Haloarculaceae archaeon]
MSSYATAARLVNLRRLRAIYAAVRHDAGTVEHSETTDPELVALVAEPYESLDGARDRLGELEELLRRREDRRAVFLTIYTAMTRAVQHSIENGTFADPEWMRTYTVTFANYYREAFSNFEQGRVQAVPEPWRIAFETAVSGDALIVQDAFLGINAHINYDLALAIRDVGVDPNRAVKREDHRAINDILARLVDAQQAALADLYASGIDDVDVTLGRFDEIVSLFTLTEARAQAWRVGTVLADVDFRPVEAYARWVLRTTATGGAVFVLAPSLSPDVMRVLEQVERGDQFDFGETLEAVSREVSKATDGSS